MNSKGHLIISVAKSGLRIIGAFIALKKKNLSILCGSLVVAETLGIAEELVDKR